MSKNSFDISLMPFDALQLVKDQQSADLVHEEYNDLGQGRYIGTLVYEKYYFRTSNRAALIVIIDNISGVTNVRTIGTGSSEGLIFKFDWGASDNFVASVENILGEFIIE